MTIRTVAQAVFRWTARILGTFVIGLVIVFAVGEGVNLQGFGVVTGLMMIAFLLSLAGMLVLWRCQLVGGIMVLIGMAGFYTIEYVSSGGLPGGWVLPVCFVPGVLALVSWVIGKTAQGRDVPVG